MDLVRVGVLAKEFGFRPEIVAAKEARASIGCRGKLLDYMRKAYSDGD
jgi:hypothetical protein